MPCVNPRRASRILRSFGVAPFLLVLLVSPAPADDDFTAAEHLFRTGKYAECARTAADEIDRSNYQPEWRRLKINAELAEGNYAAAKETAEGAVADFPASVELRLLAHEAYLYNDQTIQAATELDMVVQLAQADPRRFSSPEARIALGRVFLKRGADARQVLEIFYDPVAKRWPAFIPAHLASAELALQKQDYALAADTLAKAPREAHVDPDYHYLQARAFIEDDASAANDALAAALKLNPRHIPSLLLQVENLIDGEQYDEADDVLNAIIEINSRHPVAWAYKAVLAHLSGDPKRETAARKRALATWSTNPEVDYTIGRKLAQKYRFAEGAASQRRALHMDKNYLPARIELAQNLLRLGREDEGWQLADEVFTADGYNVLAHNLVTLRDSLQAYRILATDDFRVRMEPREAALYGPAVLELLAAARDALCKKYDVELDEPVTVEIFPRQKDFAVRTFGFPGADGFLGVCFGNVITANSPAALGGTTANWESVLWHEFCHVVTLRKTRNKMPRWLSEGISVYEERQANPAWGQSMTPEFRERILAGKATPVSQLSSAFLTPESPADLSFAYFESSLVVEYLVDKHGLDAIKALLDDIGAGMAIDDALVQRFGPPRRLDEAFETYARQKAAELAPKLAWDDLDVPPDAGSAAIRRLLDDHPNNFHALVQLGEALVREQRWKDALEHASNFRELYPEYIGQANSYEIAARASRELNDNDGERDALIAWVARDAEAVAPCERLIALAAEAGDWKTVAENARRILAINPLTPAPHRALAEAAAHLGDRGRAIAAYEALLQFESTDSVDAHYRLAALFNEQGDADGARRHVVLALETAPRFLAGHRMLLDLADQSLTDQKKPADP